MHLLKVDFISIVQLTINQKGDELHCVTKELVSANFVFPIKVMEGVIRDWPDIRSWGVTLHDCGDIRLGYYKHHQTFRISIQNYFRPLVDS